MTFTEGGQFEGGRVRKGGGRGRTGAIAGGGLGAVLVALLAMFFGGGGDLGSLTSALSDGGGSQGEQQGMGGTIGDCTAEQANTDLECGLSANPSSSGDAAVAVLLAVVTGGAIGAINGLLVTYVRLQPFITTLVMMLAGRGIAKVITDGQNTAANNAPFKWLVNGTVLGFPVVFLIALGIVGIVGVWVRRSAFGLVVEAIGINPKAAWMAGIRPAGILLTVYVVSGVLAAIAGVFSVGSVMVVDVSKTGYQAELDAILAVVVGGTSLAGGKFSIRGALVGALLIATLDKTVLFLGVSGAATPAFKAVVIVVLCLLQSQRVRSMFARRRAATVETAAEPVKGSVTV